MKEAATRCIRRFDQDLASYANRSVSSRENFLRAVEFSRPQWIPIVFELLPAVWKRHGSSLEKLILRYPDIFEGYERGQISPDAANPLYIEGERVMDDWGCTWYNAQDGILGQVVGHPLENWNGLGSLRIPDPAEQADWKRLEKEKRRERDAGLPVIGFPESFAQGGFFDRLQFLRGLENLLIDFVTEPPELHELIDMVLGYNMRYVDLWLEMEVDVIWFHGDVGTQNGLLMSPETFRKWLKPSYMKMFQRCRSRGVHVWYSSDGNILEIVDDLVECGVSLHDPQVRANTIEGIARLYRGKLCALVDLDEQMLPYGTPEEIEEQVREIVQSVGTPEGGLMLYAIPSSDVPLVNIDAICRAWMKYRDAGL
jgi:uroporphyrinogen decarboxylase